jgi:peptidylprolyl isomerase
LDQLVGGLREGIPLMVVGEIRRFWIPESLGYKGMGMIVFDVELLKIEP